jgi:DNA-directed RNA polymerase specialized sigma24 family protein
MMTKEIGKFDLRKDPRYLQLLKRLCPEAPTSSPEEVLLAQEKYELKVEEIVEKLHAEAGSFFLQMLEKESDQDIAKAFGLDPEEVPHWRGLIASYAEDISKGVF